MTHPKPSVDLGYPTPAHGRIPAFQDIEEEAAFWDTHSFTDFDDELTPVEVQVSKMQMSQHGEVPDVRVRVKGGEGDVKPP